MILNINQNLSFVTLKDIASFYTLSVPTKNACAKNGLTDLYKIISFYLNHKSFNKLRFVGKQANQALVTLCQYSLENPDRYEDVIAKEVFISTQLQSLSAFQKEMIDYQIQLEIKALRTRINIYNVIMYYLNDDMSFDNFATTFFHNRVDLSLSYHQNIGTQALKIVADVIQKIEKIALEYAAIPDKVLNASKFMAILTTLFPIAPKEAAAILATMQTKTFQIFSFLNYLLENEQFIESRNLYILKYHLDCFETEKLTLTAIGENLGISREQAKQLGNVVGKMINQIFVFLSAYKYSIQHFTGYESISNESCFPITQSFVNNLNESEKTNFSKKFICQCLGLLGEQSHILFGHDFKYFKNTYLIRIPVFKTFLFEAFFDKIKDILDEPLYEPVCYQLSDFLNPFMEETSFDLFVEIQSVCKKIITNEFFEAVQFDFENNIIFKSNIQVSVNDKIVMILREKNHPMQIHEIYAVFKEKYPNPAKTMDYIKKTLFRNKIFIYFGRSSTYGLAEWEETQNDIKGGTIRDIVETYLKSFEEPKHISEIATYVLKYRPQSDLYKINTNLIAEAETTQRFREFKGNFWGLSTKKYEITDFNETPAFFLRYVKRSLSNATDTGYETILAELCHEFKLETIQVQYFIEKYVKEGILRRENNRLEIC